MRQTILFLTLLSILIVPVASQARVRTGAEELALQNFQMLRGKSFGLITNQTAQVNGAHLIDVLDKAGVPPAVIFTPEHGLEGSAEDGVKLGDGTRGTIPVKSLYGADKKPRLEDLEGLDYLLFDIQDIGVRYYTYISTMGLAMQAAAEAGVPFVVLDRPNPLGGDYVAGFPRTTLPRTFTSLYPIPMVHGLTVGELALMIQGEELLPGLEDLDLLVVEMDGWERWMRWPDTGLPFVPTSPNIPAFETSLLYAGVGLVEATGVSEGRGTDEPFHVLGAPGVDGEALARELNRQGLEGLHFEPVRFTPQCIKGKCSDPKYKGKEVSGVRIEVTDYRAVQPVEAGLAIMAGFYDLLPEEKREIFFHGGFDDMAGSLELRDLLAQGIPPRQIAARWSAGVKTFLEKRERYLLYSDRSTSPAASAGER